MQNIDVLLACLNAAHAVARARTEEAAVLNEVIFYCHGVLAGQDSADALQMLEIAKTMSRSEEFTAVLDGAINAIKGLS